MAFHEAMNRIRQSDTAPLYIGGLEVSRRSMSTLLSSIHLIKSKR